MLSISHEYVVGVATLSSYVLLFELNAWEDEWLVAIKALQEGKRKEKNEHLKFHDGAFVVMNFSVWAYTFFSPSLGFAFT